MKIRNGFVSNSSSSSFLVFNAPTITNMSELINYLQFEPNAETRSDFDYMLSLFQRKQKFTKKEIIELLAGALEDGNIPFFDKLFKETMDEEYNSSVMQFMVHNDIFDTDDFDKFQDMLLSPIVKKFVNYMWMFNPMTILEICNTEKYYTEENRKINRIKWDRKYKARTQIYKTLAENIYEKLKEEKLLESLIVFEVGDDCYPEIEQGYYFQKVDNIVSISNH